MPFVFEKLNGLSRERLLAVVEPILLAHGLEGVEIIWRTDQRGWLLYITLERPGSNQPGAGVTLDDCTEVSRDLSAAFDADDVMPGAYRLEVGTPGVERKLYTLADYERFVGLKAKVKCSEPVLGQWTLVGKLSGVEGQDVLLAPENVPIEEDVLSLKFEQIQSAQLVLDLEAFSGAPKKGGARKGSKKRNASNGVSAQPSGQPQANGARAKGGTAH